MLSAAGHEVSVELDTKNAVASMERRQPDLAILDVMFPENPSAGFELARTMRHYNERLKGVPVLIVTAINHRFALGGLAFGARDLDDTWLPADGFLDKPLDFHVLRQKVAAILKGTAGGAQSEKEVQ